MTNAEIWRKVEELRAMHGILRADQIPVDLIRSKTAELIAPRFGVHPIAIETRFDREGIWPSPF